MNFLQNNIDILCSTLISLCFILLTFFKMKKNENNIILNYDGIEKLAKQIKMYEYEQYEKQKRQIKEFSDHIFNNFYLVYCKKMKLDLVEYQAKIFNIYILNNIRKITTEILIDACYNNHFFKKSNEEWTLYKQNKKELILSKASENVINLWDDEILKIKYKDMNSECESEIKNIFYESIDNLFDTLRDISIDYNVNIKKSEKILKKYKRKKRKKKKHNNSLNINLFKN